LINFQRFLSQIYPDYNLETILKPLVEDKINRYLFPICKSPNLHLQVSNFTWQA